MRKTKTIIKINKKANKVWLQKKKTNNNRKKNIKLIQ